VAFDNKVSRRHFLKILAAGATTLAFGSMLGFSNLFSSTSKTGRSGIGGNAIQQAAAQSAPGAFASGPNTGAISIHAAILTNGKVFYAAGSGFNSDNKNGPFLWNTFDPNTGSVTNHTVDKDLFCMGQSVLPNGKVLCAGGTLEYDVADNPDGKWKGLKAAYEYDPDSNSLQEIQSMHHGRWYPYCIPLEDGKVLTIAGWDELGSKNRLAEIYDPGSKSWSIKYDPVATASTGYNTTYCVGEIYHKETETWTYVPGSPCYGGPGQAALSNLSLYPRAVLMPTGLVGIAGQSKTTKTWNPQTGELKFAGNLAIERNYGNMVLLPLNNDAAETGQLLVCGGSNGPAATATTAVQLLTPKSPNYNTFTFQTIASCNFGRRHAPNAYLPDGKLIFFGGTNFQNSLSGAYYNAEIFDPVAKSWTVVNGMNVPKIYHSTGILLLDGRVWLAGSQYAKSDLELRSEFYVPSYYNATRPTISGDPSIGGYGGLINIPTPDAANIEKVSLIPLSTFTHGFNSQMRFIWLQIQSKGSSSVTVSAPVNAKIAPLGYYMIHVLNSAGVPSIAKVIKIPGTGSPPPPADTTPPTVGITSPSNGATISGPSSGVTVAVTGTAADESGGSGIQKVEVQVGSSNPFKLATATGPGGSADWSTWSASDVVATAGSITIISRATDNAGNTKESTINVTVTFTGSGTYTTIYSQAGTNSYIPLNSGGTHRAGEIMTSASVLVGNSIKKLTVKLKKAGNPTGTISVVVRKGTGDSIAITFGTIDAATLTTADQTFTLESPTSHTFAANDKVLVEWDGTPGTSTDQVLVKRHAYTDATTSFDGINTKQTTKAATSTAYGTNNNYDMAGEWFKLG
jgi:hypothetical protein